MLVSVGAFASEDGVKPKVTIISMEGCTACDVELIASRVRQNFPGIRVEKIDYKSKSAKKIIAKHNITSLPAFVFNSAISVLPAFQRDGKYYQESKEKYILKPEYSGLFYFLDRKENKKRIDIFIDKFSTDSKLYMDEIEQVQKTTSKKVYIHDVSAQEDKLSKESSKLIKELKINRDGIILIDNKYIFSFTSGSGSKLEEFLK